MKGMRMNHIEVKGIAWHAVCFKCRWNMISDSIYWLGKTASEHESSRRHRVEIVPANGQTMAYDERRLKLSQSK